MPVNKKDRPDAEAMKAFINSFEVNYPADFKKLTNNYPDDFYNLHKLFVKNAKNVDSGDGEGVTFAGTFHHFNSFNTYY